MLADYPTVLVPRGTSVTIVAAGSLHVVILLEVVLNFFSSCLAGCLFFWLPNHASAGGASSSFVLGSI